MFSFRARPSAMIAAMNREKKKRWMVLGVLFILIFLLYAQTLNDEFHYDDKRQITDNSDITGGHLSRTLLYPRNLTMFSFGVNHMISGLSPWSWHLVNILLFGLLCSLLFGFLYRIAPQKSWTAFLVAAIFAVHPLCTQAVAYISQRAEILCGIFSLLALGSFLRFREKQGRQAVFWGGAVIFFSLLAVRSKETAVVLPGVFLVAGLLFPTPGSSWKKAFLFCGIAAGFMVLFQPLPLLDIAAQKPEAVAATIDVNPTQGVTRWIFLLSGAKAVLIYFRLMFFPVGQTVDHFSHWSAGFWYPSTLLPIASCAIIAIFAFWLRKKNSPAAFGIFWTLLFFLPVTTIFPLDDLVAEHRALCPMVGMAMAIFGFLEKRKLNKKIAAFLIIVLAIFFVATTLRVGVWDSDLKLWTDAARKEPAKARPWNNLGIAKVAENRISEARQDFARAVKLDGNYRQARENLGNCCVLEKDLECAIREYKAAQALKFDPVTEKNLQQLQQYQQ